MALSLMVSGGASVLGGEYAVDVANATRLEEPLEVVLNGETVGQALSAGTSSGLLGVAKDSVDLVVSAGENQKWDWNLSLNDGRPLAVVLREKEPDPEAEEEKVVLELEKFEFRKNEKGDAIMVFSRLHEDKKFSLTKNGKRMEIAPGKIGSLAAEPGSSVSVRVDEETLDLIDIEEEGNVFLYVCEDKEGNLRMFHWYVQGAVVYLKN